MRKPVKFISLRYVGAIEYALESFAPPPNASLVERRFVLGYVAAMVLITRRVFLVRDILCIHLSLPII